MFSLVRTAAAAAFFATLAVTGAGHADTGSGAYLAGRQAVYSNDFSIAAQYFTRALMQDMDNPGLMESTVLSQLAIGRVAEAAPVAARMEELGLKSQMANMVLAANLIAEGKYEDLLARQGETQGIGPLVDDLLAGWAHMGAGSVAQALAQFDRVADENVGRSFALYHKALALALVGDYEGAEALYADTGRGSGMMTRRGAIARAQILSQLQRNDEALEMLAETFGANFDPGLTDIADRLAAGEQLPFTIVTSVQDGLAEVFYSIGMALSGEASDDYSLIYGRLASFLRPDHIDALLLSAQLLDSLGQYELAVETYKKVPSDSSDYSAAEMGRAEALRRAAKPDAAIEVLEQLAKVHPTLPMVHSALGDLLRQEENYEQAVQSYDRAIEFTEEGANAQWFILYARGISHERLKNWEQAEADFRKALDLNPNQPLVLNYLGYSLVEKQVKLDEALDMIERAVAGRPDSGYIVDSLGWVLYRLGRYDEAVGHMEKAVELMPVDPVVNDHLGDVYWSVGRKREAEFQWKRALSFVDLENSDGEADPDRMRRKLEIGLDKVLEEEGAAPLKVSEDDG